MTNAPDVERAVRLNRVVFPVMLGAFGLVGAALFLTNVSDLYFFDPPWGAPSAVGGFPVVCWFVLIPVAVTAALALQTPALLVLRSGGRVPEALRASGRGSGMVIAALGALGLLASLIQEYEGAAASTVIAVVLFVEGIATVWVAWRGGRREADTASTDGREAERTHLRFRGQRFALLLLLGFGCFGDVRETLPYPRLWYTGRTTVDDIAWAQVMFESEQGRFAKHLSELGWPRHEPRVTMTEADGVLTIEFRDSLSPRAGLAFGFDRTVRCAATLTRDEPERAACMPPAPRGATTSDIGPWWVLTMEWFGTLFIGVPLVLAAAIGGVLIGRGR